MADARPQGAHLVGSVPLAHEEEVFRLAAEVLGDRLRRLPDGETGSRSMWIVWQQRVFDENASFEPETSGGDAYATHPKASVRDGVQPEDIDFVNLGYADAALASWSRFAELQASGVIPRHLRFQVSLPTPVAPVSAFVAADDRARVEPAYAAAMRREVRRIVDGIPHDRLAIQWDIAVELGMLEGLDGVFSPWFDDVQVGIAERVAANSAMVPHEVEFGLHLCYGDFGHKHFVQPTDAGRLTELANAISGAAGRPIAWIHMPVPRDRDDEAYFQPLNALELGPETELYLGVIHASDGIDGARKRVAAAGSAVERFGVAAECGFGRRPSDQVRPLLAIHRAVSAPVT